MSYGDFFSRKSGGLGSRTAFFVVVELLFSAEDQGLVGNACWLCMTGGLLLSPTTVLADSGATVLASRGLFRCTLQEDNKAIDGYWGGSFPFSPRHNQ